MQPMRAFLPRVLAYGLAGLAVSVGGLGLPVAGGFLGVLLTAPVLVAVIVREPAPAALGLANRVTLGRLALVAGLGGQVLWALIAADDRLVASGWTLCIAYGVAAVSDALDGPLARRFGGATAFGARLDAETDALGIAAAATAAVSLLGTLPAWYLVAGLARYLFAAGLALGRRLGRSSAPLPPSPFRRRLAGFQMGLLVVCLGPWVRPEWAGPSTLALGGAFLIGFAIDFLFGAGVLDPRGFGWRSVARWLRRSRRPAAISCAVAAVVLGGLRLAGPGTGAWALGAFFLGWLLWPESRAPGVRSGTGGGEPCPGSRSSSGGRRSAPSPPAPSGRGGRGRRPGSAVATRSGRSDPRPG